MYKSCRIFCWTFIIVSLFAIYSTPTDKSNNHNNNNSMTSTTSTTTSTEAGRSVSRKAVKKVLAVETPEGDGVLVRRSIGSHNLRNLTPFLMLDHFRIGKGAGFPDHPHRGQATVTYMLEG
jgi:hypothetical protein